MSKNFETFGKELEKQLDLLGLIKNDNIPSDIVYFYDVHSLPLIDISYNYSHISSPIIEKLIIIGQILNLTSMMIFLMLVQ